ncbi:MAG: YfhO family protein [Chloroflexota bacterium]
MLSTAAARFAPALTIALVSRAASGTRRLRHELAGGGVIAIALMGLFGRSIVPGVLGQQRDTGAFYYPLTAWLAQELAAGRLPLWCPLIFAGYPMVADGEIGLLYPPNILMLLLFPVDIAFVAVRSAHYLLAAVGLYGLARILGLQRTGAIFGGVTFALGGFMLGHLDHGNIVRSAAWLPFILACGELALRARDRRLCLWLALGAASLAMAGLGLHPQILLIDLVALGLYVGLRALALMPWQGDWRALSTALVVAVGRVALVVGVIAGLGLCGAAIQLIPTYELGAESSRGSSLTYLQASAGGLAPVDLLTLLLPYGFRADPAVQWMRYPYWESTIYVGVTGLVMALVGLVAGARRVVLPLVGVGLIGLLLAMSTNAPIDLYGWLWPLPGFSSMRAPVRYTLIVELVLALLAAVGVDRLRAARASRGAPWLALAVVAAVIGLVAGGVQLRNWLLADEARALRTIQEFYLTLPHDRPSLTAQAVREGLLGTLRTDNRWTVLTVVSGAGAALLLSIWAWQRRGSALLAGAVVVFGVGELLLVAHTFHPIISRADLRDASRPMRFLSAQPGYWRTLLAGRSDLSVTSRPALFGVAQAYGYSSLPTTRMERYWTRINEVDDDLLDLWNVRYVVESKSGPPRSQVQAIWFDPSRPLMDGPAGSPLGDERFRVPPAPVDAVRVLGALNHAESLTNGEAVAEITLSGPDAAPITVTLRAGDHLSEAAYDEAPARMAHRKASVGIHWEPRDPTGRVYPRDIYVADLALPTTMQIQQVAVRTIARQGTLRLVGLGLYDRGENVMRSVLPSQRAKYSVVYEGDNALVYENLDALPRAFLASRAVSVPPDDWAITQMVEQPIDPRTTVLLERPGATGPNTVLDGPPIRPGESAEIVRYDPDRVIIRVHADEARYLVLADTFFPGWNVWVDGRPGTVDRANYLFRAVSVPPGEHLVEWRYQPASLRYGLALSIGALGVMLMLMARGLPRKHATEVTESRKRGPAPARAL